MADEKPNIYSDRFSGKRVLVTGGSRGIGAAIARRLGAEGALVAICYRTRSFEAEQIAQAIVDNGGQAFTIQVDLEKSGSAQQMLEAWDETTRSLVGDNRLDALVNCAGITSAAPLTEIFEHAYDRIMAINTKAPLFVSAEGAKRMYQGGRIVTIGSGAATQPGSLNGAYGMSKAALLAMTRSLAVELGPHGITANVVAPGYTKTDNTAHMLSVPDFAEKVKRVTARDRLGMPEDVAALVCWLASDDSGWVTGQWIEASGGYKMVPPI
ncbi:SDR family NAD(P)-dependent oxidoreductase [Hyphomonas johnsonii]|uniref:3-oxoacyl-[acyl-carrier protein] reductase n=1 Tax=Hyphomonas johnsonii MHS-2 TaxID=1280950 RepID=A0A059FU43_9PROT|nr:SDR family oxidoreductase [Hyphomonas johnsonii]KCZ94225.1 3-oxoacyl-[acyl-carrier protein] reductase [Hyphomonas johnsonii MHS-2]